MKKLIVDVMDEFDPGGNPYLRALEDGSFSHEDFVETQIQFLYAVLFFNRPMAALAARIPHPKLRLEVLRNVWEEHGEGDPSRFHEATFRLLLERLGGVTREQTDRCPLWPEVRAFNTTLTGACVLDEYLIGAGVMGMIERMFCSYSGRIGGAIVQQGWIASDQMIHYDLHEELDVRHSQDFFDVLQPAWDAGGEDRYYIEQGLRLGAYTFDTLYRGLFSARTRRRRSATPQLQTRATGK